MAAGAATLIAGCGGSSHAVATTASAATPQPNEVLNFALNLEYLEASFYLYATKGTGLSSTDMGTGTGLGTVTGGSMVTFTTPAIATIAAQIADDEQMHVELLRTALGAAAVPMPTLNLNALGIGFKSQAEFLTLARAFEDTGVSAYTGAAPYLASTVTAGSSSSALETAAQILSIEAYHASNIRLNLIQLGITVPSLDSQDVPPTAANYFATSGALGISRTPQQVLNIVYAANGATGVTKGGFYTNGMNGTIVST